MPFGGRCDASVRLEDYPTSQAPGQVCVVVLNWNNGPDTAECLRSLEQLEYPALSIMVVDNGSTDDSVSRLREEHPDVDLLEARENLGYAGGNNFGLLHAMERNPDYVLLLNNDTIVDPSSVGHLVAALETDHGVGIAGPTIYYHAQPGVIWSAGGKIDWRRGNTTLCGIGQVDEGQFGTKPRTVDFVTGCAIMVKREVIERVGLLDERFFAYYEEVEWCVRAVRAGYRAVHTPLSHIWHKISPSARAGSPLVNYYMTRNRLLLLEAIDAGPEAWFHTLAVEYLRTLASWTMRPQWRSRRLLRKVMVIALRDYFLRRFGKGPALAGG